MWGEQTLRIGVGLALLGVAAAGCGEAEDGAAAPRGGSEVTVVLPPPAPPVESEVDGAEPPRQAASSGPVTGQQAAWAGVLRRVGFPCERITSVRESGGGYRVECAGGEAYRATRRDGRIKFSRWRAA